MELNLKRPLIVFDLETTGLDLVNDRIIQISYIKVFPDGKRTGKTSSSTRRSRYRRRCRCSHTSLSQMSRGRPRSKELAPRLAETFRGCDFCGFNSNKFDVPMLSEEFSRAQVPFDFSESLLVDAQNIFHKMERRNLAAAYKFYTGHKMEDDFQSHRADQDAEATLRVLKGQLDMYAPGVQDEADRVLNNDIKELAEFSKMNDNVDFAGRIIWKEFTDAEGKVCRREVFNFGQHRGEAVADVVRNDPGFISWMLSRDFTYDTKNVVNRIRLREAYKNK